MRHFPCVTLCAEFQFTHPGRGATSVLSVPSNRTESFNSRTPGGVRQKPNDKRYKLYHVSIHAPREGCDSIGCGDQVSMACFNSRTPGGVRLDPYTFRRVTMLVSIHAPREGCDVY